MKHNLILLFVIVTGLMTTQCNRFPFDNNNGNGFNHGGNGGYGYNDTCTFHGNLPTQIATFIATNYPDARIIEVDMEDDHDDINYGGYDVEIVHQNKHKELSFDANYNWLNTHWDIRPNQLPNNIQQVITQNYDSYRIDDAEYYEVPQPQVNFYSVELEKQGFPDVHLRIDINGNILQ